MNMEADKFPGNFIRAQIEKDVLGGKNEGRVRTRFPPEPSGYLHIGHAKALCLSFGLAEDFGGFTNLRFDDTNPLKESSAFVEKIKEDIAWLGFRWRIECRASDYFVQLYELAEKLILDDKAYVDSLTSQEIREYRGTLTEPGKDSPYRNRQVGESLDLFRRMRAGEFADGEHILRLKIDMGSPNLNLRDPAIYRIRHVDHHETGSEWCIYPMYDYTHCISDSIEGITHSLCDLSFEDHRPLYDWVLDELNMPCHPQQIEFSRLNLQYTVMSKRKLRQLVDENLVDGWDDPRLPTLSGLRRRGFTASSIRDFCQKIGVTKSENNVELALLYSCIREELENTAPRSMGVLQPIKLVIENLDEDERIQLQLANHPKDESMGYRSLNFSREIYIDRSDFREEANRKYKRLVLGGEVRLRYGFVIKAEKVVKNAHGEIQKILCSCDRETLGKNPVGRKVRGVIHWLPVPEAVPAQFNVYENLFSVDYPDTDPREYRELLNPNSLKIYNGFVEPRLELAGPEDRFQFEREGYFCIDSKYSRPDALVLNRVVGLKDSWTKMDQA
ncbi:MAG: glutamine--tRNA ligase [Gammaproteobacteria bacterium]|nr:glutamine--tRNA ligase [Gammaproteobacteria bacterium]